MDRWMLRERARALRRNATPAQRHLWQQLRSRQLRGFKFRRQALVSGYGIADFYCAQAKLIVEVGGAAEREGEEVQILQRLGREGFTVLRFSDHQVLNELHRVRQQVLEELWCVEEVE
jgi:very-short-patch-repair endonuclease